MFLLGFLTGIAAFYLFVLTLGWHEENKVFWTATFTKKGKAVRKDIKTLVRLQENTIKPPGFLTNNDSLMEKVAYAIWLEEKAKLKDEEIIKNIKRFNAEQSELIYKRYAKEQEE